MNQQVSIVIVNTEGENVRFVTFAVCKIRLCNPAEATHVLENFPWKTTQQASRLFVVRQS